MNKGPAVPEYMQGGITSQPSVLPPATVVKLKVKVQAAKVREVTDQEHCQVFYYLVKQINIA